MKELGFFSVFSRISDYLGKSEESIQEDNKDLSRGKLNEVSKEAFAKVDTQKGRHDVLALVDGFLTTFEIADKLGKPIHKISGRFTELKKEGKIEFVGKKKIEGATYSVYQKSQIL